MANIISNDILLQENDLDFFNGDFLIGDSNEQIANLLFLSNYNDWKNSPLSGLNLNEYINSGANKIEIQQRVSGLMVADGFSIQDLEVSYDKSNNLNIKTNAIRTRL